MREPPETMTEFINRRFGELVRADPEGIGQMMSQDILKIIEAEFYDSAFDPVPAPHPTQQ